MGKKVYFFGLLLFICLIFNPLKTNARDAGCYSALNSDKSYSYGDIITYDLGSSGITAFTCLNGFHFHIEYDPTVLELVPSSNDGAGSYHGWEKINVGIIKQDSSRFNVAEVEVQTTDKSKMVTSDKFNSSSDNFVKLGYVRFKVINDNVSSTKLTLVQNWDYDRVHYGYSMSSYKMIYDYEYGEIKKDSNRESDYEEACYDTINTHINIQKKAYINNIIINNSVIKNYDKNVYTYNLTYTTKNINIEANTTDGYTISGDLGKKTLNYGNNVYKISVVSPTGDKKEYTLNINYPDNRSNVSTLKSLTLSTGNIDFKPEINSYSLEVDYEVDKITINSELSNTKSSYVKVQSEKGTTSIYTLNVTRKEATNTCDIKELKIDGYNLDFNTEKSNYTLEIDYKLKKLNIDVSLINEESNYKIIGNENLINGSKITIKVTDKNNKEKDYFVNIVKDMSIPEKEKNKKTIIVFSSIIAVGVIGVAGLIIYLEKSKKKKNLD